MREVECPSLFFIDVNVPMLTPGHVGVFWECSPPWALSSAKRARLLKLRVTLRLMVGQSVSLGVEPHEIFITVWHLQSCFCEAPLWWEDGSVFCICCWPLPAQSFLGQSPLGLATIFYCPSFETSLSIASYSSQGHGVCIPPCPHTGVQWELFSLYSLHRGPVLLLVFTEALPVNS
jgi:hypothetical protein